jgi:phospholipase/carboxylesterase
MPLLMSDLTFVHRFEPGNSARTLLLLHGTGGDENDLIEIGRAIDHDAGLLSPRGKVLENGAPRFFRRLAEGVFDEEDVVRRANELGQFVENAAARYKIDINNVVAVGYSNGANIAAAMLLLGASKLRSAILFRSMQPLSKVDVPSLAGVRILMANGQIDPIIPLPNAQRLAQVLQSAGAEVDLRVEMVGHQLIPADVTAARGWLGRTQ